jgi:MFS transporter, NNP family, nitrate/nitrite transporter
MLALNTCAFIICFAAWMLNGVLVIYLVDYGIYDWSATQVGWLLGIPVLSGSVFRLPAGILTDRFGGRWVFGGLLLFCSVPVFLLSYASCFLHFAILGFLYGLIGTGFAVGVAYTSAWYPKKWQGTALGIFGAGNAGAAITTLVAPTLLNTFTSNGAHPENWRELPKYYAAVLVVVGCVFLFFTENRKSCVQQKTLGNLVAPLASLRVWRFGLYYFLVFGCFVAFAQWLVSYFVNVYSVSLVEAGLFASLFSLPSGVIRILGGWLSDRYGARKVMYWVLGSSLVLSALLIVPRMEITSPGQGVMASRAGRVQLVSADKVVVDQVSYDLVAPGKTRCDTAISPVLPLKASWHEPVVKVGDLVVKKQLLARARTRIYFDANIWVFASLACLIGIVWGIGKAAVYKHIPEYFPENVGVVGGMVGVIGGIGGFACPILFGYLLELTGLWTSSWMFMLIVSGICLLWMHNVVNRMMKREVPHLNAHFESKG